MIPLIRFELRYTGTRMLAVAAVAAGVLAFLGLVYAATGEEGPFGEPGNVLKVFGGILLFLSPLYFAHSALDIDPIALMAPVGPGGRIAARLAVLGIGAANAGVLSALLSYPWNLPPVHSLMLHVLNLSLTAMAGLLGFSIILILGGTTTSGGRILLMLLGTVIHGILIIAQMSVPQDHVYTLVMLPVTALALAAYCYLQCNSELLPFDAGNATPAEPPVRHAAVPRTAPALESRLPGLAPALSLLRCTYLHFDITMVLELGVIISLASFSVPLRSETGSDIKISLTSAFLFSVLPLILFQNAIRGWRQFLFSPWPRIKAFALLWSPILALWTIWVIAQIQVSPAPAGRSSTIGTVVLALMIIWAQIGFVSSSMTVRWRMLANFLLASPFFIVLYLINNSPEAALKSILGELYEICDGHPWLPWALAAVCGVLLAVNYRTFRKATFENIGPSPLSMSRSLRLTWARR